MKKLIASTVAALALAACGSSDPAVTPPPTLTSAAAIATYLDGKTMLMTGADIPTHPNGYSQDMNFGASTQCYKSTSIAIAAGTWSVTSQLGTLNGAPNVGNTGTCDRTTPLGTPLNFSSSTVLIENVAGNATCFDITVTYTGFSQEGRAAFSADGKTLRMELFFGGRATGHRCASGAVGASTVILSTVAFTGNAVQTYRLP
jgi:hypothetical protein